MIRRCLLLTAVVLIVTACSAPPEAPPASRLVTGSPSPSGSPEGPTPTAIISRPAPSPSASPSPVAGASPSPVALSSPSPVAVGSPAAAQRILGTPVPEAEALASGPHYAVVAERSEAAYRARETFVSRGAPSDAVGTTRAMTGEIQLDADGIPRGRILSITIDLRTLTSDQPRRDAFVRSNTLNTDQFPFAAFHSTESAGPVSYRSGDEVTFQIPGVMTIRGQDRPIVWDARARLDESTLMGSASSRIRLTDFGLEPPRLAVLSVEDEMTWQIDIVAERVR